MLALENYFISYYRKLFHKLQYFHKLVNNYTKSVKRKECGNGFTSVSNVNILMLFFVAQQQLAILFSNDWCICNTSWHLLEICSQNLWIPLISFCLDVGFALVQSISIGSGDSGRVFYQFIPWSSIKLLARWLIFWVVVLLKAVTSWKSRLDEW